MASSDKKKKVFGRWTWASSLWNEAAVMVQGEGSSRAECEAAVSEHLRGAFPLTWEKLKGVIEWGETSQEQEVMSLGVRGIVYWITPDPESEIKPVGTATEESC